MRFRKQIGIAVAAIMVCSAILPVYAEEAVETASAAVTEEEEEAVPETAAPSEEGTKADGPTEAEAEAAPETEGEVGNVEAEVAPPIVSYPATLTQVKVVLPGEKLEGSITSYQLPDGACLYGFTLGIPLEEDGKVNGTFEIGAEEFLLSGAGGLYLLKPGAYTIMRGLFGKDGTDYMDALAVSTDYIRLPAPGLPAGGEWEKFLSSLSFLIPEAPGEYTAEGEEVFDILSEEAFNAAAQALTGCLSSMDFTGTSSAVRTVCEQAGAGDKGDLLSWTDDPAGAFAGFWNREEDGYGRRLAKMFREPYDNGADVSLHGWRDEDGCGLEYSVQAPVNGEGIGAYSISFIRTYSDGMASYPEYQEGMEAEEFTDVSARFFYILDMGRAEMEKAEEGNGTEEAQTE